MITTGEPSLGNDLRPNIKITDSYIRNELYNQSEINIKMST